MAIKVGINGFGRIGRLVTRCLLKNRDLELAAVNDLADAKSLAHLFKYDSTFGVYSGQVEAQEGAILIDGRKIKVLAERAPSKLPWKSLGVELVIESTGRFTQLEDAEQHIQAGAKEVILSAPGKGEMLTVCMGINEGEFDPEKHRVVSNASCTTNCLAPMVSVLHDRFGVEHGLMTTIHSYTNDQVVLDQPHKDLRRGRAAAVSMIPSSTGAAKAIGLVVPELKGKLHGIAIRVPTQDVSLVDLAVVTKQPVTAQMVNEAFKKAAQKNPYLQYCTEPLVSKDFTGNAASCIFDATLTAVMEPNFVKIFGWYDNEWAYANRIVDLAAHIAGKLKVAV